MCDVVKDCLPIAQSSADFVLCFFVLSAIAPEFHSLVATKLLSVLKPGGKVLLRDYGRYDEAQLRFGKGKKLQENFYVRQDGTCAYYFTTDELRHIFTSHRHHHDADNSDDSSNGEGNGPPMVRTERCEYVLRQQANRKLQQARYRVWVEAVFVKGR